MNDGLKNWNDADWQQAIGETIVWKNNCIGSGYTIVSLCCNGESPGVLKGSFMIQQIAKYLLLINGLILIH